MRAVTVVLIVMFLLAASPLAVAENDEQPIATGHIQAGVFLGYPLLTLIIKDLIGGVESPEATPFSFPVAIGAQQGQWIETVVDDHSGTGHFVEMVFYDEAGHGLGAECEDLESSHGLLEPPFGLHEITRACLVPDDAHLLIVYAHTGVDLDVAVVHAEGV